MVHYQGAKGMKEVNVVNDGLVCVVNALQHGALVKVTSALFV